MAREKDEAKRQAILRAAKSLFAGKGYNGTSIADLAAAAELPVGSVYTYFDNKEAILSAVVDEGWGEFYSDLTAALGTVYSPEQKLGLLVDRVLPSLYSDVDFIVILLSEGGAVVGLEEKLEQLSSLIGGLILELSKEKGLSYSLSAEQMKAALCIFFLGSLNTVRLSRSGGLAVKDVDIQSFLRTVIEMSFQLKFPDPQS